MPQLSPNFIIFLDPDQGREVYKQWIPRARLGLFIRLLELSRRIDQALTRRDALRSARLIDAYFALVGFNKTGLPGIDQIAAYTQIAELNQVKWLARFQTWERNPDYRPPAWDYEGRQWVYWIHKLASRYSWTRDEVLGLFPEEAAALIQEIFASEIYEADEARALSRFGYKEEQAAGRGPKTLRFQPTPRPGWMIREVKTEKVRVRRSMLPFGIATEDGEPTIVH